MAKIWHFSGAGNDFVVLDGRREDLSAFRDAAEIGRLCREYRTDGLMILSEGAPGEDFTMEFYNPDGSSGMMCGNGGRCIAAFAHLLGIKPGGHASCAASADPASSAQLPGPPSDLADPTSAAAVASATGAYLFRAADGLHTAEILSREGSHWVVRLGMKDVEGVTPVLGGYFLDTGTRHFVKFVPDVEAVDIATEGPALRHAPEFAPIGANVNFVQILPDGAIKIRTFEKGVEGETLACGTGITASALATAYSGQLPSSDEGSGIATSHKVVVHARKDTLEVDFSTDGTRFTDVYLTGPADCCRSCI